MHPSVMDWVGKKVKEYNLSRKQVLECGSRNYNGSVRGFFKDSSYYVGIDMNEGPGVDLVASANAIPF